MDGLGWLGVELEQLACALHGHGDGRLNVEVSAQRSHAGLTFNTDH